MRFDTLIKKALLLSTEIERILIPNNCCGCRVLLNRNEYALCVTCLLSLPKTHYWEELENNAASLFWGRFRFDSVASFLFFVNKGSVQLMLHNLKYRKKPEVGLLLGQLFGLELAKQGNYNQNFLLIPVPMHPKKQAIRGYNQAEIIANGIARSLPNAIVVANALSKTNNTKSQTKMGRLARFENIADGFEVIDENAIKGANIILIDDVLTTGATLEACGKALEKAKPNSQHVLTIAVAAQLG